MRYKIKEIGRVITGSTPPKKFRDSYGSNLPFLTPKDMVGNKYSKTERSLSQNGIELLENRLCNPPSVSVSCIGSDMGKACYNKVPVITNQQINTITEIDENRFNPDYVYYTLSIMKDYFQNIAGGSTMPIINKGDFENIEINLPNINIQNAVAEILSLYDELIKHNIKMISNLEKLAQTLFKHWFVDFEFPNENGEPYKSSGGKMFESELGMIPEGWKVGKLSDISQLIMGQSPKSSTYNDNKEGMQLINGASDFKKDQINPQKYTSDPKRISKQGDFLFGVRATVGNVTYVDKEYALGRGVGIARPLEEEYSEFIYFQLIQGISFLERSVTGSVYINFTRKDLEDMKVILPKPNLIKTFHQHINYFLNQKYSLLEENKTLTELRDTLLPKLLSGEIELPESMEVMEDVPVS